METSELLQILLGVSFSANSFFATYFLAGIKGQVKSLRKEFADLKKDNSEIQKEMSTYRERQNMSDHKMLEMAADLRDLPCMSKSCSLNMDSLA